MQLTQSQEKLRRSILGRWSFLYFLMTKLPMGFFASMRLRHLDDEKCIASIPFNWVTKNPFKSTYFAVQSMAAELSTATPCLLAITGTNPSIAFIIVDLKATFSKKATDTVYFTCEDVKDAFNAVALAQTTGEPQTVTLKTIGKMKNGTVVSEFEFTWSFKSRKS
ncbi:MAG: hypothetical protein ACJA1A_003458 [Saprospiraceae bacterium]|jgi:hypothetical protein